MFLSLAISTHFETFGFSAFVLMPIIILEFVSRNRNFVQKFDKIPFTLKYLP